MDARNSHSLILRGLPSNIRGVDLHDIFENVSAASISLPRAIGSYKSRPWAYFMFKSEVQLQNAMDYSCSFNGRPLEWISADQAKKLCPRYSSLAHAAKDCDAFSSRPSRSTPKNVQSLYNRFNVRGRTTDRRDSGSNRRNNNNSSRSRSRSRSRNNNNDSRSDRAISQKRVSYANAVKSSGNPDSSLEASLHAPNNSNKSQKPSNKGKGVDRDADAHTANIQALDKSVLLELSQAIKDFGNQLSSLQQEILSVKEQVSNIDSRLHKVELHINASSFTEAEQSNFLAEPSSHTAVINPSTATPIDSSVDSPNPHMEKIHALESTTALMSDQLGFIANTMNNLIQRLGFSDSSSFNGDQ